MDNNLEEEFYIPNYQKIHFEEADTPEKAANKARRQVAQSYSASLKMLNNYDSMNLLKKRLAVYNEKVNSARVAYKEKILKELNDFGINVKPVESSLQNCDISSFIKPLHCSKSREITCTQSENVSQEIITNFAKTLYKPSKKIAEEPRVRKISKNFAPRTCSRSKNNETEVRNKYSRDHVNPTPEADVQKYVIQEDSKPAHNQFRTAREEFKIQSSKKYGSNSNPQNNQIMITQKRKLGTRRGVHNKFVSPLLSNSENNSEENSPSSQENEVDERLKNIEPRMVELIQSEIMDIGQTTTWDDIAGLESAKTAIQEAVVWPLLRPDIFTGLRRPPKGILLFGPPGTGKTLIGKCVASQSKSTFFSISASSLTSKWIGDGEKMVRALFAVARCHQPAVIFIDEVDSLLCQRSETEHESSRRMKTEFLVQLDGATTDSEEHILLIGATNRPQELDEAARRRFVKRLYIPLPDYKARLLLIQKLMSQERNSLTDEDMKEIAELSSGYSGADMKNLCSEAALGPIRSIDLSKIHCIQAGEVRAVAMEDFRKAFTTVKSSVSSKDLDLYVEWDKTYGSGSAF